MVVAGVGRARRLWLVPEGLEEPEDDRLRHSPSPGTFVGQPPGPVGLNRPVFGSYSSVVVICAVPS